MDLLTLGSKWGHQSRNVKQELDLMNLEFKREVWVGDIQLGVIGISWNLNDTTVLSTVREENKT